MVCTQAGEWAHWDRLDKQRARDTYLRKIDTHVGLPMFDLRCLLSFFISPHTPARVDKKCSALNFFSVRTCSLLFALVWPCVHCFSKWVFTTLFKVTFLIKLPTENVKKCHLAGRLNPRRSPQQRCGSINTSCAPKKRLQSRNNYPSCSSTLIFCRQVKHFWWNGALGADCT